MDDVIDESTTNETIYEDVPDYDKYDDDAFYVPQASDEEITLLFGPERENFVFFPENPCKYNNKIIDDLLELIHIRERKIIQELIREREEHERENEHKIIQELNRQKFQRFQHRMENIKFQTHTKRLIRQSRRCPR